MEKLETCVYFLVAVVVGTLYSLETKSIFRLLWSQIGLILFIALSSVEGLAPACYLDEGLTSWG